ncbi:hypothetical protein ADK67_26125 [Saccharothrix sp. NRRL B-16348]|uniref:hypothetical protein n=1 Tax=Saccharothrix sp. NRRL B-16348 TaxID=1415542 RepID=UPI0006B041C9|nr:hypothetical protein [Saccharothrix sp. NRRL B-16348]KOX21595.1 hypothetical protein ADK67_26125 [Saccharothrix sp. NRRL B-16348]
MTAAQEPPEPREPVDPDEIAEEAPIDPTPQEVDEYRSLIGDETPEPGATRDRDEGQGQAHAPAHASGERSRSKRRVPDIPEF